VTSSWAAADVEDVPWNDDDEGGGVQASLVSDDLDMGFDSKTIMSSLFTFKSYGDGAGLPEGAEESTFRARVGRGRGRGGGRRR
jgi:hypothetical protein